eukprot:766523-Hanusia_phi.AAC.4
MANSLKESAYDPWNLSLVDSIVENEAYADVSIGELSSEDKLDCETLLEGCDRSQSESVASHSDHDPAGSTLTVEGDSLEDTVTVRSRKEGQSENIIKIDKSMLQQHFHEKMETAAKKLVRIVHNTSFGLGVIEPWQGVGKSTMKLVCRKLGVLRWPYTSKGVRKIRKPKTK